MIVFLISFSFLSGFDDERLNFFCFMFSLSSDCHFKEAALSSLFPTLSRLPRLENLDLSFNDLTGAGASGFCLFLQNCRQSLVELNVSHCGLSEDVFRNHLSAFQIGLRRNEKLEYLSLAANRLNEDITELLRSWLSLPSTHSSPPSASMLHLNCLDLSYNRISASQLMSFSDDVRTISKPLGVPCLDSLDLSGNVINFNEKESLLKSFEGSVKKVDILVLNFTNILADHVAQMWNDRIDFPPNYVISVRSQAVAQRQFGSSLIIDQSQLQISWDPSRYTEQPPSAFFLPSIILHLSVCYMSKRVTRKIPMALWCS